MDVFDTLITIPYITRFKDLRDKGTVKFKSKQILFQRRFTV